MSSPDALAALRFPFVRAFAAGRTLGVIGAQIVSVTVGWQLYERTGDAWSLGLVGVFQLIPVLLLMVPAGNAVDRFPRRNVAMFAHVLLGLSALGLAWVSWQGASTATIYALLVLVGVSRAFSAPSVGTILPQLLAPEQFANANAWLSTTYELASLIGPAIGGALIALTGDPTLAYLVAAGLQGAFLLFLTRVPAAAPPVVTSARGARDVFAGFSFIRRNPVFLAAISLDLFAVLLGGAVAILPIYAKDILHVGPGGLGWLRAAPGFGAMTMALITTRLRPWRRPGVVLLTTVVGFGLSIIGFGLSRHVALSLAFLFLSGVFDSVSVVIRMTLEQMITTDALRGRVSAINYVFIGFSNELGAFESGAAAALFGPIVSVVGGGIGTILVVLGVARIWPQLRRIGPLHTLRPSDPAVEESIVQASGG